MSSPRYKNFLQSLYYQLKHKMEAPVLVLSRKKDDEVIIVDETGNVVARLTVVKIEGHKVRLGIEADKRVKILRGELMGPG